MTAACWYKSFSVNKAMKRITSGKFSGIWLNSVGFKNKTQALKHGRSNCHCLITVKIVHKVIDKI